MNTMKKYLLSFGMILALSGVVYAAASAGFVADSQTPQKLYDAQSLKIHKGVAAINPGGLTWTNYNAILTFTPSSHQAVMNCKVVVDLALATTGFAAGATSQTITFDIARKVDGTNFRTSVNKETTAISGTNSTARAIELDIGEVGPNETVAVYAKVSSITSLPNVGLPYLVSYRSGVAGVVSASN